MVTTRSSALKELAKRNPEQVYLPIIEANKPLTYIPRTLLKKQRILKRRLLKLAEQKATRKSNASDLRGGPNTPSEPRPILKGVANGDPTTGSNSIAAGQKSKANTRANRRRVSFDQSAHMVPPSAKKSTSIRQGTPSAKTSTLIRQGTPSAKKSTSIRQGTPSLKHTKVVSAEATSKQSTARPLVVKQPARPPNASAKQAQARSTTPIQPRVGSLALLKSLYDPHGAGRRSDGETDVDDNPETDEEDEVVDDEDEEDNPVTDGPEYTDDEEPELPPLLDHAEEVNNFIKMKDRLKEAVMQKRLEKAGGFLRDNEQLDITTSDIQYEVQDTIRYGQEYSDYDVERKLKLYVNRQPLLDKALPDCLSSAVELFPIGVEVNDEISRRYPGKEPLYNKISIKITGARRSAGPRTFTVPDLLEESDSLLAEQLQKWRDAHPRTDPLVIFDIRVELITNKRRHDIASDPPSDLPSPAKKKGKNREDVAIEVQRKAIEKAANYQLAGDFYASITREHKCMDKNCSNFENMCYVLDGAHYNVTGDQQAEWANHIAKGLATAKVASDTLRTYWVTQQGPVGRGCLAPMKKASSSQAMMSKINDIGMGVSQLEAAQQQYELNAMKQRLYEADLQRRRMEREEKADERRERDAEYESQLARRRLQVSEQQQERENAMRLARLQDDEDERRERREYKREREAYEREAERERYYPRQHRSSLPHRTTYETPSQHPLVQPSQANPRSPIQPTSVQRKSSSPISDSLDGQAITTAFFNHCVTIAHGNEDEVHKWQTIYTICKQNDWLLDDLKHMHEEPRLGHAVKQGIPHGTAMRMRRLVEQFKISHREKEKAAGNLQALCQG